MTNKRSYLCGASVLAVALTLGLSAPALAQSSELEALMSQTIVSTPSKDAESSTTAPAMRSSRSERGQVGRSR